MQDEVKIAIDILERALNIEQEGRQFYLKAVKTTQDKDGQEIYATLAGDEMKHYNLIKSQYDSLVGEKKWTYITEIKPVAVDLGKSLFPIGQKALEKTVSSKSSSRDALLFGLDIETRSYDLYRKAALDIAHPLGKQMCIFLAGQEQAHFELLMMRYDALFGPISWSY